MIRSSLKSLRGRLWLRRNINPFLERASRLLAPSAWLQGREIVFQNLVHRELDRLEIKDSFYPLRSAANYSYLYLLLRLVQECPGLDILELGAGESTVLLDRLKQRIPLDNTTLENDTAWTERIGQTVATQVIHAPLVRQTIRQHETDAYQVSIPGSRRFNVLLVDGPRRSKRRSRWASLAFVEAHLAREFLIVFDDAERRGEIQTIAEALKILDERNVVYGTQLVRSINSQFLIASPKFEAALRF